MLRKVLDNGIEYLLIFMFIAAIALFLIAVWNIVISGGICTTAFECRDEQMQACMQTDRYSHDECLALVVKDNDDE